MRSRHARSRRPRRTTRGRDLALRDGELPGDARAQRSTACSSSPTARTRTSRPRTTRSAARAPTCSPASSSCTASRSRTTTSTTSPPPACSRSSSTAPACVIVKHANPCGVGVAPTIEEAYEKALAADPVSAYGGVVVAHASRQRRARRATRRAVRRGPVRARLRRAGGGGARPEAGPSASSTTSSAAASSRPERDLKRVLGGLLVQERDSEPDPLDVMESSAARSTTPMWDDLLFAWTVVKHVTSNAIVIARGRPDARHRRRADEPRRRGPDRAREGPRARPRPRPGAVLASDAFFPFADGPALALEAGVGAIIQPGGSKRDDEVIAAVETRARRWSSRAGGTSGTSRARLGLRPAASRQTCKEAVFEAGPALERCYGGRRHGNAAGRLLSSRPRSCGHSPREHLSPHLPARACARRLRRSPRRGRRRRHRIAAVRAREPGSRRRSVPLTVPKPPPSPTRPLGERAVTIAKRNLGAPYRWGGVSPSGFDCSGLVTYVFGQLGVSLPHNAAAPVRIGPSGAVGQSPSRRPRLLSRPRSRRALRRRRQVHPRAAIGRARRDPEPGVRSGTIVGARRLVRS